MSEVCRYTEFRSEILESQHRIVRCVLISNRRDRGQLLLFAIDPTKNEEFECGRPFHIDIIEVEDIASKRFQDV